MPFDLISSTVTVFTVTITSLDCMERRVVSASMTIDELTARTGVTSRTIREYQAVGVLAPPERVGRVGYYDDTHVRRLDAVRQLQSRGYSLAGIRDLFDAWESGQSLTAVLGVDDALTASSVDERPALFSAERLEAIVPGLVTHVPVRKAAQDCGLIREVDDGWFVTSRSMLQLVSDAVAMGVAIERTFEIVTSMAEASAQVAAITTKHFVDDVWAPFVDRGSPDDERARIEVFLRRSRAMLQKAAASSLMRAFEHAYASIDPPERDAFREALGHVHVGAFDDLRDEATY